jgi:hypothetical protein
MNTRSTLLSFPMALSLVLSAGQSLAEDGYFGVSILDGAQHNYPSENNLSSYSYYNLGSDKPFSDFGVAILDSSEHDYVIV